MWKSILETFGLSTVWSTSSENLSDNSAQFTNKRKRQYLNDDPDVQIIKVEKKRKVESDFSWIKRARRMAQRFVQKPFTDNFALLSPEEHEHRPKNVITINGNHSRDECSISKSANQGMASSNHEIASSQQNTQHSTFEGNFSRTSSTSSYRPNKFSTANRCVRLKDKEEYQKMLIQYQHSATHMVKSHSSPKQSRQSLDSSLLPYNSLFPKTAVPENISVPRLKQTPRKSFAPVLDYSLFPKTTVPENISVPRLKQTPRKSYAPALGYSLNRKMQDYDKSYRSNMKLLLARQRALANQSRDRKVQKTENGQNDSGKLVIKPSETIVIDNDSDVEEIPKPNNGIDVEIKARADLSDIFQRKLDFRCSKFVQDDYIDELQKSRRVEMEQRGRLFKDAELGFKAFTEKRHQKEQNLEKSLQYKMRIFDQEPEVVEEIYLDYEEEETLPELTEEMQECISKALRPGPRNEILSEGFRLQIKREDIATLGGLNWLNDEIINFYMNLLMERGEQEGYAKTFAFNTFFYPKIVSGGHAAVRRWTKKVDIFAVKYVLIPVHLGVHWCLCVVNIHDKSITYYDSMGGKNNQCLTAVFQYLNDESVAKKGSPLNKSEWQLIIASKNPQQMNGSDCGMFACKYAEYITREKDLTFTQENIPYFRRRMVYEILSRKLLQ